jgi:hypothetical protein
LSRAKGYNLKLILVVVQSEKKEGINRMDRMNRIKKKL